MALAVFGLAGSVGVGSAQPAGAAKAPSVDLSVELTTTVVSAGHEKFLAGEVRNAGPDEATGLVLTYDVSALDASRLTVSAPGCTTVGTIITCTQEDLRADGNISLARAIGLTAVGSAGAAGSVTVKVAAAQADPDPSDNTSTVAISVDGHGADLVTFGEDVKYVRDAAYGNLEWMMFNQGDEAAVGVTYTVHLPARVGFQRHDPDCTYSADGRDVTCTIADWVILPDHSWATNNDSGINLTADITTPNAIALTGGTVTSGAIRSVPVDQLPPQLHKAKAPKGFTLMSAAAPGLNEVDTGDNSFHFTMFVEALARSSPSAARGGELPVTGDRTAVYAAIGAVTAATGVALLFLARRRRISA
jgi:LPXTG-motif cell wall-anchored protein